MSQLCRTCHKPAKIVDSRNIARNVTKRRYHCMNAKCADKWSSIEMPLPDNTNFKTMQREMAAAARTVGVLKQCRNILNKALPLD